MVVLKNIKKTGNIISCDYYPEDESYRGHIIIDLSTKNVVEHTPSKFKGRIIFTEASYAEFAKRGLLNICTKNPLPNKHVEMWY